MKVEYRVRPVTRYVVTRYHEEAVDCADGTTNMDAGCETRGEFDRADTAYEVAYALCKAEHQASGESLDSMNFIYPDASAREAADKARRD